MITFGHVAGPPGPLGRRQRWTPAVAQPLGRRQRWTPAVAMAAARV